MRIIAGRYRSRRLAAPPGLATRPTSDRLRETLFNVLAPSMAGARFLDLYAGSGAVGIEALSRGAGSADFVERAPAALKALRANLAALGLGAEVRIHAASVGAMLRKLRAETTFDLVFLDPPYYAEAEYAATLSLLGGSASRLLSAEALVIAEHRRNNPLNARYEGLVRTRLLEQGDAALHFFALRHQAAEI